MAKKGKAVIVPLKKSFPTFEDVCKDASKIIGKVDSEGPREVSDKDRV